MNIIEHIILVGAIQGFFLSALILMRRGVIMRKLFALVLFFVALALTVAYLQSVSEPSAYPFLIKLNILFPLIFIPLLLVYLKKVTGSYEKWGMRSLLLFVPLALVVFFNLPFYLGDNALKLDYYMRYELNKNAAFIDITEGIFIESVLSFYGFLAILEARSYKKRVDDVFSNHTKTKIGWINFLAASMFSLTFFSLLLSVGTLLVDDIQLEFHFLTAIGATIIVYYIAYFFLLNPEALVDVSDKLKETAVNPDEAISSASQKNEVSYLGLENKLLQLLETEQLYTNPELTVGELADKASIPVYLTSKIINQNLDTNFYNLVNKYRLAYVKQALLQYPQKTVIEIAYSAGFNSKTTFYEAFKKETGTSPSEFIKQHKAEKAFG